MLLLQAAPSLQDFNAVSMQGFTVQALTATKRQSLTPCCPAVLGTALPLTQFLWDLLECKRKISFYGFKKILNTISKKMYIDL